MTCSNLSSAQQQQRNNSEQVSNCAHCGLPVYGHYGIEPQYCCCGCEMAASVLKESNSSSNTLFPPHLFRVIVAFIASMFVTLLSATIHQEAEAAPIALSWISFVLTLIVFSLLAKEFLQAIAQEIRKNSFSIASLVFIGSGAAFTISSWNLFSGNTTQLFYETAAMALTLYVISLTIDAHFKLKLSDTLSSWKIEKSISVLKVDQHGDKWRIDSNDLAIGDSFLIEANAIVPVDSLLRSSFGEVDEAHLHGEAFPVVKHFGEEIKAGSIWLNGEGLLEAKTSFSASSLKRYFNRVQELKAKQSVYERVAEKGASILLTVALVVSAGTLFYHTLSSGLEIGILNALSVLLISCPCGLAIATPIAFWITIYQMERAGIMVTGGGVAIEKLAGVQCIFFDKTGTLTERITISDITHSPSISSLELDTYLSIAVALESAQAHPIALAFRHFANEHEIKPYPLYDIILRQGKGIEGKGYYADTIKTFFLLNQSDEQAKLLQKNELGLYEENDLKIIFKLTTPFKQDLQPTIEQLHGEGFKIAILTGDHSHQSAPKGIEKLIDFHSGLSPNNKAKYVREYEKKHGAVVFVGDGINDLEAMANSTSSIAMFNGSNETKSFADFTLYQKNLSVISEMITLAQLAKQKVMINLIWAISYNLIGIALAAMGYLNPLWAIAIMTLSSTMVTLNSLSLLKFNISTSPQNEYKEKLHAQPREDLFQT